VTSISPTVIDTESSVFTVVNEFHVTPEQQPGIRTFPPLMCQRPS